MAWPFELVRIWQASSGVTDLLRWLWRGHYRRRLTVAVVALAALIAGVWNMGFQWLVSLLLELVFGIPAPGKPLDPWTWMNPTNGLWPDVMAFSQVMMVLSVVLLLGGVVQAARAQDVRSSRQWIKRLVYAGMMIVSTWTVLPLVLHLADQIALGLSPSVEQWSLEPVLIPVSGWLAVVVGTIMFVIQPPLIVTSLLAMGILRALILIGFILWPVAWTLRILTDSSVSMGPGMFTPASIGKTITTLFSIALVTKVVEVLVAFFLLNINVAGGPLQAAAFVVGVGLFTVFPVLMLQNAERVLRLAFLAPRSDQVGHYIEQSADRVGQAHTQVQRVRERFETDPQTTIQDWNAERTSSSSRWRSWISHQFPKESFTTWGHETSQGGGSGSTAAADGSDESFGPVSRGPDESVSEARKRSNSRDRSQVHDE